MVCSARAVFRPLRSMAVPSGPLQFPLGPTALYRLLQSLAVFSKSKEGEFIYSEFISKALRYGPRVTMGSHSFACHTHTNHTCLYSPAARHHRPLAGTHCAYPRKDGQAELTWVAGWSYTEINVHHRNT